MGCRDRVTGRQLPSNLFTAHVRGGSFATGPNRQQVRPCPRCRREQKENQSISGTATGHCGLMEPPWSRLKLRNPSHESCATYSAILNGPPIGPRPGHPLFAAFFGRGGPSTGGSDLRYSAIAARSSGDNCEVFLITRA